MFTRHALPTLFTLLTLLTLFTLFILHTLLPTLTLFIPSKLCYIAETVAFTLICIVSCYKVRTLLK